MNIGFLAKSKKSAAIMTAIVILAAFVTVVIWSLITGSPLKMVSLQGPNAVITYVLIMVLAVLIMAVPFAIGSTVISTLSERHFGLPGALRWAVMGVLYGVLACLIQFLFPSDTIVRYMLLFAALCLSYALVFYLAPLVHGKFLPNNPDNQL